MKRIAKAIHLLFSDPSSSRLAYWIFIAITLSIIGSCVSFIVETLPSYKYPNVGTEPGDTWEYFETFELISFIIFGTEYGIRILTVFAVDYTTIVRSKTGLDDRKYENMCCYKQCPSVIHKMISFFFQPTNMIDFVSLLPGILLFDIPGARKIKGVGVFRIFRLFRVFRLFRAQKLIFVGDMFYQTFRTSVSAIYMLIFFSAIVSVIFGSLMFFLEEGEWVENGCDDGTRGCFMRTDFNGFGKQESPFFSIPQAIWYTFVTVTTVGYGDLYPTTDAGKALGIVVLHMGILILALPITIIQTNFSKIWKNIERQKEREKQRQSLETSTKTELPAPVPAEPQEDSVDYVYEFEYLNQRVNDLERKIDFLVRCEYDRAAAGNSTTDTKDKSAKGRSSDSSQQRNSHSFTSSSDIDIEAVLREIEAYALLKAETRLDISDKLRGAEVTPSLSQKVDAAEVSLDALLNDVELQVETYEQEQ